ncbi:MAG: NuoI/complex I 23 kDa subunit family protein [Bacteroidia bacterium]
MKTYFLNIKRTLIGLFVGLYHTWQHFRKLEAKRKSVNVQATNYFEQANKAVTIQYPKESIPVPDLGRYRLDMETEDCIVCDKCARICPVNCIDIKGTKTDEDLGHTSDGSTKRLYLNTFDIDMAKCCFCGLCTTVCPTECLTMTKVYDFSEYERENFIYQFGKDKK